MTPDDGSATEIVAVFAPPTILTPVIVSMPPPSSATARAGTPNSEGRAARTFAERTKGLAYGAGAQNSVSQVEWAASPPRCPHTPYAPVDRVYGGAKTFVTTRDSLRLSRYFRCKGSRVASA